MISILTQYHSTIASIIGFILVYCQAKWYIDNDQTLLISGIATTLFGAINVNNHINK